MVATKLAADSVAGGKLAQSVANLPALPISLRNGRPALRRQPPVVGEHGLEIVRQAGFGDAELDALIADGTLSLPGGAWESLQRCTLSALGGPEGIWPEAAGA